MGHLTGGPKVEWNPKPLKLLDFGLLKCIQCSADKHETGTTSF